jgi:hypothetical protein
MWHPLSIKDSRHECTSMRAIAWGAAAWRSLVLCVMRSRRASPHYAQGLVTRRVPTGAAGSYAHRIAVDIFYTSDVEDAI